MLLAIVFLIAAIANLYIALKHPRSYTNFADVAALPAYETFIRGYFSRHVTALVSIIAICQLLIGIFIASRFPLSKLAVAGAAVFLLAIAPLGTGAAFPSSVFAAIACIILLFKKHAGPDTFIIGRPGRAHS
ncbi:hypothetical protein MKQ70_19885 [Chitinophaga sedimenti]|uniref:hypothetical protein n=1 Tax=Chitinophaga sedimenti TaxID=2033606 RepID=UPI002002CD01|nr:hypothetical protein [Chitinophaga sedimenti]MCK7557142.1 hypothetical protein [Chitinophaga sedimenti]